MTIERDSCVIHVSGHTVSIPPVHGTTLHTASCNASDCQGGCIETHEEATSDCPIGCRCELCAGWLPLYRRPRGYCAPSRGKVVRESIL
jgi:hypothetical protein